MIIDCHGHFTKAPAALQVYRDHQLARLDDPSLPEAQLEPISDSELRGAVEANQLRVMRERGSDVILLSPRASGMQHHVANAEVAVAWARECNNLIYRVTQLFPRNFVGVAQLPQTPDGNIEDCVEELRRCVKELGFVACNVNPDPSGGHWQSNPMTDVSWFPLYHEMVALTVPAMVHVSASCNPNFHTLGAHYLNADTTVFMQLLEGNLFQEFPELTLIIPHGGGAAPYHWGRYQGLAARYGRPRPEEHVMGNVFFDTAVYHQAGMDLLFDVVETENLLFSSEMLGAVRGVNPETSSDWDDTLQYIEGLELEDADRRKVLAENALRAYPRLSKRLELVRGHTGESGGAGG